MFKYIQCPHCGKRMLVDVSEEGKTEHRCPVCRVLLMTEVQDGACSVRVVDEQLTSSIEQSTKEPSGNT